MTAIGGDSIRTLGNIRKSFGAIESPREIDLRVSAGEVAALLGENGAGKSAVSNVISGEILPNPGEMTWTGAAYAPANPREAIDVPSGWSGSRTASVPT